jgi:hypothetical protein
MIDENKVEGQEQEGMEVPATDMPAEGASEAAPATEGEAMA